jgi:hypothetical protein
VAKGCFPNQIATCTLKAKVDKRPSRCSCSERGYFAVNGDIAG